MTRRFLTALVFLCVAGAASACGDSSGTSGSPSSAATTASSPSPSPSPTVDVKANTAEICGKAEKVVTEDSAKALGVQIGLMIVARSSGKKAEEDAAKAKVKAQAEDWAKQLRDLGKSAADPALAAALSQTADGLVKLGSDEYLASIKTVADVNKIQKDMTDAGAALTKLCP